MAKEQKGYGPKETTETKPETTKKATPKPKRLIMSVKTFAQELKGRENVLGRGFLTYCRVQRREGRRVVDSGTREELVAEFNKWKTRPCS